MDGSKSQGSLAPRRSGGLPAAAVPTLTLTSSGSSRLVRELGREVEAYYPWAADEEAGWSAGASKDFSGAAASRSSS